MLNLCDRCPQPAKHTILAGPGFLRACDHHAREWTGQRPGLGVWDDAPDDGPDCA